MMNKQKGFTLVEMTVAILIGSLMMLALMATFILQSRAYTATRLSSQIQDNARTALDTIDMMVSMAGFGIVKSNSNTLYPPGQTINPAFLHDSAAFYFPNYNNSSSIGYNAGQDNFTNSTMDGTECVMRGFNPQNQGGPCPPYGTDSLTFAFRDPQYQGTINSISIGPSDQVNFTENYPYFGLQNGDELFFIDQNHAFSALVTNSSNVAAPGNSSTQLSINLSSATGGFAGFYNELNTLSNNPALFSGGYLEKVNVVRIYVDYSDVNHPVLMMIINGSQPIPLAEDIEDFQVQFVMDDSNIATGYNVMGSYNQQQGTTYSVFPSFNNYFNDPTQGNHPHQNPYNINAIIITIVVRSDAPSPSVSSPPLPMVADHNTGTGSGTPALPYPAPTLGALANYQRQIYQRIIQIPNIRTESKLYDNGIL